MSKSGSTIRENRRLADAKVRFVYEGGVLGEWVNAREAFDNGFLTANDDRRVTGIQFDSEVTRERLRASDYVPATAKSERRATA